MDLLVGNTRGVEFNSVILSNCVELTGFACKILWLLECKNH